MLSNNNHEENIYHNVKILIMNDILKYSIENMELSVRSKI